MLRSYSRAAWRNILRHEAHAAIDISGLAVGIAACIQIFLVVNYELSFDKYQPGYNNTYRIVTKTLRDGNVSNNPGISAPPTDALRVQFQGAKLVAVNSSNGSQVTIPANTGNTANDKKFIENIGVMFVEPQFFNVFETNWLAGKASVLKEPDMVVINNPLYV